MISVVIPVFRNATSALELIRSLHRQKLPSDHPLEVIVVDDGSDDDSIKLLRRCETEQVHVLALPHNMGRSAARNAGAKLAHGEFLVFIDCDCRPIGTHFLATHLQMLSAGNIATCGPVTGNGDGFWSRYQNDASARRARQHARGHSFAGSTQNFAVHAKIFRQLQGFDICYATYGFEDRDLFARLSQAGTLGWCTNAIIEHIDLLTLPAVLEKMHRAAGESALLFSSKHARAYRKLGYAALDTRLHSWLRPVALLLNPALRAAPKIDRLLAHSWLPYMVTKPIVRLLVALAYMHGTSGKPLHGNKSGLDTPSS
ncbi:glycosyltransferase [Rhodanobacter sp. DHB23]|uniref:glycosyltransferase n=1 Tax=Rhodanobacter sp. DHB23 TaxID=2775923 RepID=UPI00177CC8F8|nr:glycosyltransferase [Rhodanobacter sp. DHB23]